MGNENPFKPEPTPVQAEPTRETTRARRDFQSPDIVPATEIPGFGDLTVVVTLEKKNENRKRRGVRNQDNALTDPDTGLVGVFDGLGGMKNAEDASRIAGIVIPAFWKRGLASWEGNLDQVLDALIEDRSDADVEAVLATDTDLARKAHSLVTVLQWANEPIRASGGMTTACVGLIHTTADGTRWLVAANIGDGNAFVRHADGSLEQATMEDSLLSRALSTGALPVSQLYEMKKDPTKKFKIPFVSDEVSYHETSNSIPEPLGWKGNVLPLLSVRRLQPGDEVLFCTDGIIDKYEQVMTEIPSPDQMTVEQMDMRTFGEDASDGKTFAERVDNLRIHAGFRWAYKITDDSAIVGVQIPEGLKTSK